MSHAYSPTPVSLTTITCPDDGDARVAASVNAAAEGLANAISYEKARVTTLTARQGLVRLASFANLGMIWESTTAIAPSITTGSYWPVVAGATTGLQVLTGSGQGRIFQNRVNAGSTAAWGYKFGIDHLLVDATTLTTCVLRLAGNTMHIAGSVPAVMPQFGIVRSTNDDVVSGLLTTNMAPDTSASGTAFAAVHSITFTADQNNVIDTSLYSYSLVFFTEASTNALAGEALYSIKLTMT